MTKPKTAAAAAIPSADAAQAALADRFERLPLDLVDENQRNPRKHFDQAKLQELAESIRQHGVVEPILVRAKGGRFEAIFGARRLRASLLAGADSIPAIVRQLSDSDALEVAVIENLQRDDVHPLEEAEGYQQLLDQKDRAYTVEDIAAKVGKSKAYVYGRMKLLALSPDSRTAFYAGAFSPSVALLVARIPGAELQKQALDRLVPPDGGDDDPVSFRDAARIVHDGFMLDLAGAPFSAADADLVKKAGACAVCPKRTGSQPDLFSDVQSGDVCTDPACFKEKVEATWERRAEEARAAGRKVLDEKQAAKIFSNQEWEKTARIAWDAEDDWDDVDEKCPDDPKGRTWREVLGGELSTATVLARDPRGAIRELVPLSRKVSLLKKAGIDVKEKRSSSSGSGSGAPSAATKEREAARKREVELEDQVEAEIYARVGAAAEKACEKKVEPAFLRLVAMVVTYDGTPIARRAGKGVRTYLQPEDKKKVLAKLGTKELFGLLAELAYEAECQSGDEKDSVVLKHFKLDPKQIELEVRERAGKAAFDKTAERARTAAAKKGGRRG